MDDKIYVDGKWLECSIEYDGMIFILGLVTENFIFYTDLLECDERINTMMYNSNMELVSNSYSANCSFNKELESIYTGEVLVKYIDGTVKEYVDEVIAYKYM